MKEFLIYFSINQRKKKYQKKKITQLVLNTNNKVDITIIGKYEFPINEEIQVIR